MKTFKHFPDNNFVILYSKNVLLKLRIFKNVLYYYFFNSIIISKNFRDVESFKDIVIFELY